MGWKERASSVLHLRSPEFQAENTDQEIFDTINLGHEATAMIGWGEVLSSEQISQLVVFIRQLETEGTGEGSATPEAVEPVSFSNDVLPILEDNCAVCHGSLGGWDFIRYEAVTTTGITRRWLSLETLMRACWLRNCSAPKAKATSCLPAGELPEDQIQVILDWIEAGTPDN